MGLPRAFRPPRPPHRGAARLVGAALVIGVLLGAGFIARPEPRRPEAPASIAEGPALEGAEGQEAGGHAPQTLAEHGADLGARLPLWSTLPFAGILLSIAIFPLLAPHFWHQHFPKVSAFWALVLAVPFVAVYGRQATQEIVHIYVIDYIPFIILLWSLFTVAGGIYVGGALHGTPRVNVLLLAVGTLLASWIGTTGAAIVMIRPLLRANAWRRHKVHVIVFFIFLVANIGGSLTPLGDPPLFLGFLHGVPFFWVTKNLLFHMLSVSGLLLAIFYVLDVRACRREDRLAAEALQEASAAGGNPAPPQAPAHDAPTGTIPEPSRVQAGSQTPGGEAPPHGIRIEGWHNFAFLIGIMSAVLFSGSAHLGEFGIYGHVHVEVQNLVRDAFLLLMGFLSLRTTRRATREKNEFSWFPILEVAYLFAGIFMTIVPALKILQAGEQGHLAGLIRTVRDPVHYFWVTGALSSFLDNAPTYLTFFNSALGSLGATESAVPGMLGYLSEELRDPWFVHNLAAISAGAVFMGANTYIGNAPNFMVKSIAEEAGIPMPSFFGYMLKYSIPILIPSFVIVSLVFFR